MPRKFPFGGALGKELGYNMTNRMTNSKANAPFDRPLIQYHLFPSTMHLIYRGGRNTRSFVKIRFLKKLLLAINTDIAKCIRLTLPRRDKDYVGKAYNCQLRQQVLSFLYSRNSRKISTVHDFFYKESSKACQTWDYIPRPWEFLMPLRFFLGFNFSKKPWDKIQELWKML